MNNICFITEFYPSIDKPAAGIFVRNLVWEMADMGKQVTVILPKRLFSRQLRGTPGKTIEKTTKGNTVSVLIPRFLFIPNIFCLAIISRLNLYFCWRACSKILRKENLQPECFYGHFIHRAGMCACKLGEHFNKPSFIAYGESSDWTIRKGGGIRLVRNVLKNVTGMIAVSSENRDFLIDNRICPPEKTAVIVNAVQPDIFYPRDKQESRDMFGLDKNAFIVAFTGSFTERKGVLRLDEAVSEINDNRIGVIYAGQGNLEPTGRSVLFKGAVPPEKMPYFLSAADVFVLPTLNEGCCNAIIEAIACGLPIISSDLPFNHDILDESCSVLVDPGDIGQIKDAIAALKNNPELRSKLSSGSLEKAKKLSLRKRAEKVLEFMDEMAYE